MSTRRILVPSLLKTLYYSNREMDTSVWQRESPPLCRLRGAKVEEKIT